MVFCVEVSRHKTSRHNSVARRLQHRVSCSINRQCDENRELGLSNWPKCEISVAVRHKAEKRQCQNQSREYS